MAKSNLDDALRTADLALKIIGGALNKTQQALAQSILDKSLKDLADAIGAKPAQE